MSTEFALDLRLARKKAGFTQPDIAHLLDLHQSGISCLERGKRRPNLTEIVELSLIYGRSFESLFAEIMDESRNTLQLRLISLPAIVRETNATFNRPASIAKLRRLLDETKPEPYES